jgi:hypothetical protein
MRSFGRFLRQNTVALLALFVALGGTTFAAANVVLPANTVGAKQLKKSAVVNKKIKTDAVTGAKIANNTVKGPDVLESSLGKVPAAANADNAAHSTAADSATNATNATNATKAATASNATTANMLNGYAANGLTRIARMGTFASLDLTATDATYGPALSITVPAAGFVMITGGATIRNAGCTIHCDAFGLIRHIQTGNSTPASQTSLNSQIYSTIAWGYAFPVDAGVNTFDIRLARAMDGSPGEGTLTGWLGNLGAVYSPFGSTGGATLGPGGASPSRLKAH